MKEFVKTIEERIKSPFWGYFAFAFLAANWRPLFYLLFEDVSILDRISYFDSHADNSSLVLMPFFIALVLAVIYPWLSYGLLRIGAFPTELKSTLQADAEHKLQLRKIELENLRSQALSNVETELIERAKRDEQLSNIEDEELRNKLRSEIKELRAERDSLSTESSSLSRVQQEHDELMKVADSYRKRSKDSSVSIQEKQDFQRWARELEQKAHELVVRAANT